MKKLKKILAKVLEVKESSITDKTSSENVLSWDSFNTLMIISEIETVFNTKLTIQEAVNVKSVKDIKDILKNHGVVL
ncbi:MAG: phosphopantetheine-binding protein [Parcubacteria group bacterium GW2011_GWA2_37_10]|nr:MAG: phosphopantetheine-binding protein [Parcubacteria group bacterium GW2011_GWA2_37_10]HLD38168.1 acyl carrier protein [Candidatus Nanoarchaeia archaeon]